jgi:D-3-phosphoglycerate dehydrogenase
MATLAFFERWTDPVAEAVLAAAGGIDLLRLRYDASEAENWAGLRSAHGYQIAARVELREPWFGTERFVQACPNLLAISSTGSGTDVIDIDACTAAGVIVCNQAGANKEGVAEHAIGMMLSLSKKIALTDKLLRKHSALDRLAFQGNILLGKTVGIIGMGYIGTRTTQLCSGLFDMTVLAYDPYLDAAEIAARGAVKVELPDLLARSDFVSVHCPRTSETLGMIGRDAFAAMKATAYFINTARGGVHKEDELAEALRENRIAGAGLDVFLEEPPGPEHPLLGFDNVIATPHIAGMTAEDLREMATSSARQWVEIFKGLVPPRILNPEAWPAYRRRFEMLMGFSPDDLPGSGRS